MNKLQYILAALALLLTSVTTPVQAQNLVVPDAAGAWTFFVTFTGAPPCQCIEIGMLYLDGRFEGPANDHFTGNALGIWQPIASREIFFAILQNNINPDGSAGGEYVIRFRMNLNQTCDQGTGSGSVQLLDVTGNVIATETFTVKGVKLKLQ